MKYRKKPVVIEAIQWDGTSRSFMVIATMSENKNISMSRDLKEVRIGTLEGVMTATIGDFIIKGVKGEVYPCKPDIFEETYEKVEE